MEPFAGVAERVDLATWERRAIFELFRNFSEPYHGVGVRVDCTETFRLAKRDKLSVFLSLVHRALIAVNGVENLKTRMVGGEPWRYATIHAGSAVGRDNGTINFAHYEYAPTLREFVKAAAPKVQRAKEQDELERYAGQNIVRFSVLPWLDFTSLSHAMNYPNQDSAPRVTFGKITERDGRHTMPVSIHVHHALADGLHVAQFVALFEKHLAAPELSGPTPK